MMSEDQKVQIEERIENTKVRVYDRIMEHLKSNKNDPRKRERMRVLTAIKTIENWFAEEYSEVEAMDFNVINRTDEDDDV